MYYEKDYVFDDDYRHYLEDDYESDFDASGIEYTHYNVWEDAFEGERDAYWNID